MRWDMDGIPSRAELEREVVELKQQVAELRKQSGESQDQSPQRTRDIIFDLERFQRKKEHEESEIRWYREQKRQERKKFFKQGLEFPLERTELPKSDAKETSSKTSRDNTCITIDWRGLPLILIAILAWLWFNSPVERSLESQRNFVQPAQTMR